MLRPQEERRESGEWSHEEPLTLAREGEGTGPTHTHIYVYVNRYSTAQSHTHIHVSVIRYKTKTHTYTSMYILIDTAQIHIHTLGTLCGRVPNLSVVPSTEIFKRRTWIICFSVFLINESFKARQFEYNGECLCSVTLWQGLCSIVIERM